VLCFWFKRIAGLPAIFFSEQVADKNQAAIELAEKNWIKFLKQHE